MADQSPKPLQFFVRLLNGKSLTLAFPSPLAYGDEIKQRIFDHTKIPIHLQRLIHGGHQISDGSAVSQSDTTVNLVLSLRGGKGGFGSLLRGAATKAGQKKTNNFDACVGNGDTQKYVKKYQEESDKCIEAVDLALEESFKNGKRKVYAESEKSKRLKIWKGKRAVEDSDSDDSSDEEDEESVVLNNGGQVVPDKGKASSSSGSEEEKDVVVNQSSDVPKGEVTGVQVVIQEKMDDSSVTVVDAVVQNEKENTVEAASEALVSSVPAENQAMCCKPEEPLNFDDFNSAKDMEVMGMERLKTELQSHGLKCGGTLQERAARLFLLKSTPIDKLPKKLLAKK
ncbi:BnaA09g00280D [Brassica napus]|uniref:BnaA09g00280D protein n=1 Tax=Brassica napus TaxID=3708 RepID=A0A078ICA9_BRANA|nr:BnaA09g00280D [Brassica napus]